MNVKHEHTGDAIRSTLSIHAISHDEQDAELKLAHYLFGPIETEIYRLTMMFAEGADDQTLYDKMHEIAAMCRNPTWLDSDGKEIPR